MKKSSEIVFIYISEFIRIYKFSPSMREIAQDLGKSVSTIHYHIRKLKENGFIDYEEGKDRTLRIIV